MQKTTLGVGIRYAETDMNTQPRMNTGTLTFKATPSVNVNHVTRSKRGEAVKKQKPVETIEDKLHGILLDHRSDAFNISRGESNGLDIGTSANNAIAKIQAIITTETTNARIDEWGEFMMADLDDGLKDEMYNEYVKNRLAALQKDQKQ